MAHRPKGNWTGKGCSLRTRTWAWMRRPTKIDGRGNNNCSSDSVLCQSQDTPFDEAVVPPRLSLVGFLPDTVDTEQAVHASAMHLCPCITCTLPPAAPDRAWDQGTLHPVPHGVLPRCLGPRRVCDSRSAVASLKLVIRVSVGIPLVPLMLPSVPSSRRPLLQCAHPRPSIVQPSLVRVLRLFSVVYFSFRVLVYAMVPGHYVGTGTHTWPARTAYLSMQIKLCWRGACRHRIHRNQRLNSVDGCTARPKYGPRLIAWALGPKAMRARTQMMSHVRAGRGKIQGRVERGR